MESIIDSLGLAVNIYCSGLCPGGLNIWPNVRRGNNLALWIKNKLMYLPLKNVQDSLLFSSLPFHLLPHSPNFVQEAYQSSKLIKTSKFHLSEQIPFGLVHALQYHHLCYLSNLFSSTLGRGDKNIVFSLEKGT